MKLKIGSSQLVCIILLQIVLIDAFLIMCFIKKINIQDEDSKPVVSLPVKSSQKAALVVKKAKKETEGASGAILKKSGELDVMKNFFITFGINKSAISDFRIVGKQNNQKSFVATAYDLSFESCGKYPSHPEYGITFSGNRAVKGKTVAVDPKIIPLGSRLYIEFPKEYSHLNGWYIAEDTGSKVKGNIIDIFFGKSAAYEAKKFGRRIVKVQIM